MASRIALSLLIFFPPLLQSELLPPRAYHDRVQQESILPAGPTSISLARLLAAVISFPVRRAQYHREDLHFILHYNI